MSSLEGKKAPDFSLPGSDGKTYTLSDFKGKTLVLYFYPKDDTPGCTIEACGFRDDFATITKLGATVVGVSKDPTDSHRNFISKYNLPFLLLTDADTSVMKAYGAWGEKMSYGKPTMGTIRSTVAINGSGQIIKHWQTVQKAEVHTVEVLDFIKSLSQ